MVMGRNGHGPKWLWAEMTSDQLHLCKITNESTETKKKKKKKNKRTVAFAVELSLCRSYHRCGGNDLLCTWNGLVNSHVTRKDA